MKFEVGDQVRIIQFDKNPKIIGSFGKIANIQKSGIGVIVCGIFDWFDKDVNNGKMNYDFCEDFLKIEKSILDSYSTENKNGEKEAHALSKTIHKGFSIWRKKDGYWNSYLGGHDRVELFLQPNQIKKINNWNEEVL